MTMGEIGEYWKDHKEHKRRRQGADALGMSMSEYERWEQKSEREEAQRVKREKFDRCTIQCECGKWLIDTAAHNSHKMVKGRKGHSVKQTKEAKLPDENGFDITF